MQKNLRTVQTIIHALPYIKEFYGQVFVVKYGGSAWENEQLRHKFAQDVLLLHLVGIKVIVVHGGGKNITKLHEDLSVKTEFKDGLRVTTKESMKLAQMVLKGEINVEIVSLLNAQGAKAVGISGKDANFVFAKAKDKALGYVGEIVQVNTALIDSLLDNHLIPVVAPIAASFDATEPGFNINADTMASSLAKHLKAKKIIFLTDTAGVLDAQKELIPTIKNKEIQDLIDKKVVIGGMIPKLLSCQDAINSGVEKAHIIDGRIEHSLLLEIFTPSGIGTQITGE